MYCQKKREQPGRSNAIHHHNHFLSFSLASSILLFPIACYCVSIFLVFDRMMSHPCSYFSKIARKGGVSLTSDRQSLLRKLCTACTPCSPGLSDNTNLSDNIWPDRHYYCHHKNPAALSFRFPFQHPSLRLSTRESAHLLRPLSHPSRYRCRWDTLLQRCRKSMVCRLERDLVCVEPFREARSYACTLCEKHPDRKTGRIRREGSQNRFG